jgi:hypothetical protein
MNKAKLILPEIGIATGLIATIYLYFEKGNPGKTMRAILPSLAGAVIGVVAAIAYEKLHESEVNSD